MNIKYNKLILIRVNLPFHFIEINGSTAIHIVHPEGPAQLLLRSATRGDMQGKHELPEVNGAAPVGVKSSEDILAKLVSISTWKHFAVH